MKEFCYTEDGDDDVDVDGESGGIVLDILVLLVLLNVLLVLLNVLLVLLDVLLDALLYVVLVLLYV